MPSAPTRRPTPQRGTCRAIFAVTGVVDDVNDLILPNAFTATLAKRPVKSVWHHKWEDPVGVVLEVDEWQPGDPRFADVPDWPAGAGALVANVAFNLRTRRGRDAYEQVKQWHEHNQAQFSIGYRVPKGGATRRSDGVRIIHTLDLFEVSPVLHGAHSMTRALEVKADPAGGDGLEYKESWTPVLEVKAAEPQINRGVMVALYPPPAVAERIAHPDGSPPGELHITLAYLGDAEHLPGHPDDLTHTVREALAGLGPLSGSIGGLGRFPDHGNGIPTWVPVDLPGLAELQHRIVGRLAADYAGVLRTNHGFTPHLTLGYDLPADIPDVPSLPVDFSAVHVVRGADRIPVWLPGQTPQDTEQAPLVSAATSTLHTAANEQKSAQAAVLAARARRIEQKSAHAIVAEAKSAHLLTSGEPPVPAVTHQPLPESYEQLRSRLSDSVRELMGKDDGAWTCIEATYPDRVIAVVTNSADGNTPSATYAIPYQLSDGRITLGAPQPVELATIVLPEGRSAQREATSDEDVHARVVQPTVDALADATARIASTSGTPDQLEAVRATVSSLVAALSEKGLDIDPEDDEMSGRPGDSGMALWDDDFADDDPEGDDEEEPEPAADDPEPRTTSDTVRLDPDEVKSLLAAIQP